jgi:curved DNA-binding protein CbpA
MPTNYYDVLQVNPQANGTIIRYAYRYLAAQYHPDNVETGSADKFRVLCEAWRVLSDPVQRQQYDLNLGIQAHSKAAASSAASSSKPADKSVSWNEIELRLAVLQVLLEARKKRPQTGGASPKMLTDCLGSSMEEMEWILWYLREKGHIERTESKFMITVQGVDYLVDQLSKTHVLDTGGRSQPVNVNLPAPIN